LYNIKIINLLRLNGQHQLASYLSSSHISDTSAVPNLFVKSPIGAMHMVLNLKRVWKSALECSIGILIETGHQIHFSLTAVLNMTIYQFSELTRNAFLRIPFWASATIGLVFESVNVCQGNNNVYG
jgi:hypothetical protein